MLNHRANLIKIFSVATLFMACNDANFSGDAPVRTASIKKALDSEPETAPSTTPPPAGPVETNENPLPPAETVELPTPLPPTASVPPVTATTDTITIEETFTQQGLNGSADIAIVIDDSGSMKEEQTNLSTKLNDLVVALKDSNWQIGVVTTSPKVVNGVDSCEITMIRSTDSDREKKFIAAVTPGVAGSGNEEGVRQAVNALKCSDTPWVRKDSTVAVLIVSDEDNCSADGKDCPNSPAKTEQYLIDYIEKTLKREVGKTAGFYGIFAPVGEKCDTAGSVGTQYQRLVEYKAGMEMNYGNICDQSYKGTLERISNNIAKLLSSQFTLKKYPDQGTVMVTGVKSSGDMILPADYSVLGNVITFKSGSEPALGSEITLNYKVTTVITH